MWFEKGFIVWKLSTSDFVLIRNLFTSSLLMHFRPDRPDLNGMAVTQTQDCRC